MASMVVNSGGSFDEVLRRMRAQPAPNFNISAEQAPELTALTDRHKKYLDDLEQGTGHAMDVAAQKFRDVREGGAKALAANEAARGVNTSLAGAKYEGETTRGQQAAIADVGLERTRMRGAALDAAGRAARAPLEMALAEKGLGLQAWQAQQAENRSVFDQYMALLNASRSSPVAGPSGGQVAAAPPAAAVPVRRAPGAIRKF